MLQNLNHRWAMKTDIDRFLQSGDHDLLMASWPGRSAVERISGIGADTLGDQMRGIVGMSVGTTCYISLEYFGAQDDLSDYVVHEAAHVFHNTKRLTIGLAGTRRREWLLPIQYRKQETFAYACEAYSRILEIAKKPADRRALVETLNERPLPAGDRVDLDEYVAILTEAVNRKNGWKSILARCSE